VSINPVAFSGQPTAVAGRLYAPRIDNPDGLSLGTRVEFSDGRAFRFAQLRYGTGGGDFLTRQDNIPVMHTCGVSGNNKKQFPIWAGERVICINAISGVIPANLLAGGYIFINDYHLGNTVNMMLRIQSHTVSDGATDAFFTLADPLPLAVNSGAVADVIANLYANLGTMTHGAAASNPCVGVAMMNAAGNRTGVPVIPISSASPYYYDWIQVAGPAYLRIECNPSAPSVGTRLGVPAPNYNGACAPMVDGTGAVRPGMQAIGYTLNTATDNDHTVVMLTGFR